RAFDAYVASVEARLERQHAQPDTYLEAFGAVPGRQDGLDPQLTMGGTRVEAVNGGTWQVPEALLHHWRGAAFVANATPKDMLAVLRDFKNFPRYYAPQVISAHVVIDNGETAILASRIKEQRVITVVLDGEYQVERKLFGNDRGYSISRSLHFWQID